MKLINTRHTHADDIMDTIETIIAHLESNGAKCYFVGGFVRDSLLGLPPKDIDIEVFGVSQDKLVQLLTKFGTPDTVGKSFGVTKLGHFDFNLPRRERKNGVGHKAFECEIDPTMTLQEAASRRDYTINAISIDSSGNLHDFHNGMNDLNNKFLHHTSQRFSEDPLRVLRGFQFAGRFDMIGAIDTMILCGDLFDEYKTLALERIWGEWKKWATKSIKPSSGLWFLVGTGWIKHYPELDALIGVPQDYEFHPEGGVWQHSLHVCDAAADIARRENLSEADTLILVLGALCHDLGKATCTVVHDDGRITSYNHEAQTQLTESFLQSIGAPVDVIKNVVPLVREHMAHLSFGQVKNKDKFICKLARRLEPSNIVMLDLLVEADMSGRPPIPKGKNALMNSIVGRASEIGASLKPVPKLITGKTLVALGHAPGPKFGEILERCYQTQMAGGFSTEAEGIKVCGLRIQKQE